MTAQVASWHVALQSIASRGSQAARPGSLAGLHAARAEHQGQFWTPRELVELCWRIITPVVDRAIARSKGFGRVAILDSSCGVGRMFWPADPDKHRLVGCDIDAAAIAALAQAAQRAGFRRDLRTARLEDCRPTHCGVALINPPFGLTFTSPALEPVQGITTWGRYGRDTSASSHAYAIAQTLGAAAVVLAIVPASFIDTARELPVYAERLRAIVRLPAGTFREESTEVATALLVFGHNATQGACGDLKLQTLADALPDFDLECHTDANGGEPRIRETSIEDAEPVITLPVTHDDRVRVAHDGRKLVLKFACGYTQARVLNRILDAPIGREEIGDARLPKRVRYHGQGWFDLENYLVQDDPIGAFNRLLDKIRSEDATPDVDPGLWGYLHRRIKQDALRRVPLQKTVYAQGRAQIEDLQPGQSAQGTAKKVHLTQPDAWNAPAVRKGEQITLQPAVDADGIRTYAMQRNGKPLGTFTAEVIHEHYDVDTKSLASGWHQVHPGRWAAFPALCEARAQHARKLGLDTLLSWQFQFLDVVELSLAPRGVLGWRPALGKTRAALALALIGNGAHNLIVVESRLVQELVDQLTSWERPAGEWQVITTVEHAQNLARVNIISYERVRSPIAPGAGRRTFASLLRRRIHTLVPDEAILLRNRKSDQSRALWQISPKRRYALDGSVISNYVQDAVAVLQWAVGDGTALQPYGQHRPFICAGNLTTMAHSRTGMDIFRDRHICTEWVTHSWTEDLRDGARRQVPRLRDIEGFRAWLAPHVLRRVPAEPDVAAYMSVPVPTKITHTLNWDRGHLARYVAISDEFAAWYTEHMRRAVVDGKGLNLVTVLARIGAVAIAANAPERTIGTWAPYMPLTSKHRAALDLLERFTREGHKSILFANNPSTLDRLAYHLRARGIQSLCFHGGISMADRNRAVREEFKNGDVPVLLASFGCGQRGHNWPVASRGIFYDGRWTPDVIEQAGSRMLRDEQENDVEFHYLELEGSIDEYQAMMVSQKADAIAAGLDYGEQLTQEGDFRHLDSILHQFVEDLAGRWGVERDEARRLIRQAQEQAA